ALPRRGDRAHRGARGEAPMSDFDLDFGFGEDLEMLREHVRRFAMERIAPRAAQIDAENTFPRGLGPELGALGLFGVTLEPELAGAGLGYLAHVLVMEEISRASASVGLSYAAHSNLCMNQIRRFGTPEQKARFLPGLLDGSHVGALAMSEAQAGSDVLSMRTTAVPRGDDYVLNGAKMWITNAPDAEVIVVYARVADGSVPGGAGRGPPPIKAFIVERTMPGLFVEPKRDKLGMRGSDTAGLAFADCRIPASHVLPGDGLEILMSGLDIERVVLAGGPLGIMRACLDVVLPYVHERRQFDRP